MKQWYNTARYMNLLLPIAEDRERWKLLTPKVKYATKLRECCCGHIVFCELHIACEKKSFHHPTNQTFAYTVCI